MFFLFNERIIGYIGIYCATSFSSSEFLILLIKTTNDKTINPQKENIKSFVEIEKYSILLVAKERSLDNIINDRTIANPNDPLLKESK